MRKAIIRESDGLVVNVIAIEEDSDWTTPDGCYLIDAELGSPGNTWNREEFIKPEPIETEPPLSTHISVLVSIEVGVKRPAKVKRVWEGRDYFHDCFVTENIKDQYLAGDIKVGDYLLVHYDPIGEQIVTGKVFKSW